MDTVVKIGEYVILHHYYPHVLGEGFDLIPSEQNNEKTVSMYRSE